MKLLLLLLLASSSLYAQSIDPHFGKVEPIYIPVSSDTLLLGSTTKEVPKTWLSKPANLLLLITSKGKPSDPIINIHQAEFDSLERETKMFVLHNLDRWIEAEKLKLIPKASR